MTQSCQAGTPWLLLMQALQSVHQHVAQVMPQQSNEEKKEVQEQLALLLQIAQQCICES